MEHINQEVFNKAFENCFEQEDGPSRLCRMAEEKHNLDISYTRASRILERHFGYDRDEDQMPDWEKIDNKVLAMSEQEVLSIIEHFVTHWGGRKHE